jgi:hypothetical protein
LTRIEEILLYCTLKSDSQSLTAKMLHHAGAEIAFGTNADVALWNRRLNAGQVYLQRWQPGEKGEGGFRKGLLPHYPGNGLIAVAVHHNGLLWPAGDTNRFRGNEGVDFLVFEAERQMADKFLREEGWHRIDKEEKNAFSTCMCGVAASPS